MGLRYKFNLLLFFTFIIGITGTGIVAYVILENNAEDEVKQQAGILLSSAMAMRQYTIREIKPLLSGQTNQQFLSQTVPAYAATRIVQMMRKQSSQYGDYSYKEATINPTNPDNRAAAWEEDIIRWFRNRKNTAMMTNEGSRNTPNGTYMFISRPIRINNQGCLSCHGNPKDAPAALLTRYGKVNGFHWKMNQVVGAQIVSVPMRVPYRRAQKAFITFMSSLVGVFVLVAVLLNLFLNKLIIRRIKLMSEVANDISLGSDQAGEFRHQGNDEVASLAKSFNRMRRSLTSAMDMLEQNQNSEQSTTQKPVPQKQSAHQ